MESYKKENKDLKEKVNSLQIELTEKEVSEYDYAVPLCLSSLPYCTADTVRLSFSRPFYDI